MSKLLLFLTIFILSVSANVNLTGYTLVLLDAGKPETNVNVAKGELFAFKIESNPTTGYNWYLMNNSELKSSNIVAALNLDEANSGEYQQNESPRKMTGIGGNTYFKFKGMNSGSSTLNLSYMRIWEHEAITKLKVKVQVA